MVGVTLTGRIGRLALRRVIAAFLRGVLTALFLAAVLLAAVPLVVILVGWPPLSLAAAVVRVVGHRWYSWFCVGREFSRWGGFACGRVGVDRTTRAKLSGMQVW